MADPQSDPIAARLQLAPMTNAARADVWDAFQQSASADDFAAKVKDLKIPDAVKADLWDLKQQAAPVLKSSNEKDAQGNAVVRTPEMGAAAAENPEGRDVLLENAANIGRFVKDVGVGAVKGLVRSGIRGGNVLRAIPGVDAAFPRVLPLTADQVEPANTGQRLGGMIEQGAEILAPARAVTALGTKTATAVAPYLARVLSPRLATLVPQVVVEAAGNAGLVKAQGGSNTAAGVTAALSVVPPTIGVIAKGIADKLRTGAATNVERFFDPTTKPFKRIIERRTDEILERGSEVLGGAGRNRAGAVGAFEAQTQQAGEAIDDALKTYGSTQITDAPARLTAALDAAKAPYVKTRVVSAAEAAGPMKPYVVSQASPTTWVAEIPLNAAKVKQIEALKQVVAAHGDAVSVDDLVGLRRAWDEIAYAKPTFGQVAPSAAATWAKKMGGDAIRGIIASDTPELAALNREFAFWKDLSTVMEATATRKVGQVGLLPHMAEGAGQVAAAAAHGTLGQVFFVGKAVKLAQQVFASPRYHSLAANVKDGLADAITSGQQLKAEGWLRMAASQLKLEAPRVLMEGAAP